MRLSSVLLVFVALLFSCSKSKDKDGTGGSRDDGSRDGSGGRGVMISLPSGGNGSENGSGGENGGECPPQVRNASLTGTVHAPSGDLPISGALVYVTNTKPTGVPDGTYCAECVRIDCEDSDTVTAADGTFTLPATAGAGQFLVVQKGQFMRVTALDVAEGMSALTSEQTDLPGSWNPDDGEYIPRIAIMNGTASSYDTIYNVLAKAGLGDVSAAGEMVMGSGQFDIISGGDKNELLDDLERMKDYHLIFVPCMAQESMDLTDERADNIRQFVEEGGKWYVTDWANEFMADVFPDYQTFEEAGGRVDFRNDYDSESSVVDADLESWLSALPEAMKDIGQGAPTLHDLPSVEIQTNYSALASVGEVLATNSEGAQVNVGHHTWVEGGCSECESERTKARPQAVSAGYGCGRILFSTYHTDHSEHTGLTPQELTLLYIILEIGVCHDEKPPSVPGPR